MVPDGSIQVHDSKYTQLLSIDEADRTKGCTKEGG